MATPYTASQNAVAWTGPGVLQGYSIASTAGADVTIYDNTTNSGLVLAQFTLAAKGEDVQFLEARVFKGVYVAATAAIQGHIRMD